MNKFEVGQRVRLKPVAEGWGNITTKGAFVVVEGSHPFGALHQKGQVSIYTVNGFPEDFEVVKYQAMKFKTPTREISGKVQSALFELGYSWMHHGRAVANSSKTYIYTNEDGRLGWGEDDEYFLRDIRQEFKVETKKAYEFLAVEKAPETVELNGKTYLKADLEAALDKLKPL